MTKQSIIIICSARSYIGEAARVVHLADILHQAGHDITLVGRIGYSVIAAAKQLDLPHLALTFNSSFKPLSDYADVRALRRLITDRRADVVHAHRGKDHWIATVALRAHPHIPLIRTRHVVTPVRPHLANRWLYQRGTSGIICVSQSVEKTFRASVPDLRVPLRVIPGGAPAEPPPTPESIDTLCQALSIPADSIVVSLLARPDGVKGHIYLIDAMPTILAQHPHAFFIFAYPRDNTYRQTLTAAIAAHGATDRVRWLAPQASTRPLLALTDIGLIASVGSEGWSRVAVEFLAAGIPTVTTTVGSLPEIITDEETGLHVPPSDSAAIGNALGRLLTDRTLRETFGQKALSAAAPYTATRMTKSVLDFYNTIIAGKST